MPLWEVREIVCDRLGKLDEHLRDLRLYRKELSATLSAWEGKTAPGDICGFIENATIGSQQKGAPSLERKSNLNKKKKMRPE